MSQVEFTILQFCTVQQFYKVSYADLARAASRSSSK